MAETIKTVIPFSNGSQAMNWYWHNCDHCVKAYVPKNGELPDFKTTQKLVNLGKECKLKFYLDLGHIEGNIPENIAVEIGYTKDKGMPQQCWKYSEDENDRWKPTPELVDPRQTSLFPLDTDYKETPESKNEFYEPQHRLRNSNP